MAAETDTRVTERLPDATVPPRLDRAAVRAEGDGEPTDVAALGRVPAIALPPAAEIAIPGYRVAAVLGQGGMGRVYAAEQLSPRRRVAIKILHARSARALARFRTEAEIMARLDHPGIARILEAGVAGDQPFLVMDYVDGTMLHRCELPPDRERRIELVIALCDAVQHAHDNGVVHRDLKPSNVMVRPDGRITVLDFGIARLAAEGSYPQGLTRAGELIGTPRYMSPEQARLRPDEVNARSDVYTLGVMLYELLCGEMPYDTRGLELPAITHVICHTEPTPLGARDPALRGDLDAITARALRKDPAERYPSAAALADDLRRTLQHLPVSVRTPGRLEQIGGFVRRRPVVALTLAIAVITAAAFAVIVTRLSLDARSAHRTAAAERGRGDAEHAALVARTNQLTLRQAHVALAADPTDAVARLATLTAGEVDLDAAWAIADEAIGSGVAHDVLREHTGEVHWIEPMRGGAIVTGAYDGRVVLWQAPAFRPRVLFQARSGRIHAARPSPDGTMIAVGGDSELHVIGLDGHVLAELGGHTGKAVHLAWSHDGALLATSDDHGDVWLWPRGQRPGVRLQSSSAVIGSLEFAADGSALVAGDHDGWVWLWDRATLTPLATRVSGAIIETWTDGRVVAAVDGTGTVHRWHAANGALVAEPAVATGRALKHAAFAANGAWAVLGGVDGTASRVEGDRIETVATHQTQVRSIAITADGGRIATASDDGSIQVVDRTSRRRWQLRGHQARIRHLTFDGDVLLSSDGEGIVRRWDLSATPVTVLDAQGAQLETMVASPDGRWLAAVDAAGYVTRWTLANGARTPVGHAPRHVTAVALAQGTVVTGTTEGSVTWWLDPPVTRSIDGVVRAIAAGRDRVAVATAAGPIAIYTLTGDPVTQLTGNARGTEALAFSPDGAELVSGGQDWTIRVWRRDGEGFAPTAVLRGPSGDTHFVAFSPRGDRLFAAGNDGAVFGWRCERGAVDVRSQAIVARHTGAVTALAVSADGELVTSAGRDNTVVRAVLATGATEAFATGIAATTLAFDDSGAVHAVTRNGTATARSATRDAAAATAVDHGVHAAAAVAPDQLALALDDGVILVQPLAPRTFDALRATLAEATGYAAPR